LLAALPGQEIRPGHRPENWRSRRVIVHRSTFLPSICEVFRVTLGTDFRMHPAEERRRTDARLERTAITADTDLHAALSVQGDQSSTMRCRKKLYDALSVRR
jgi:hypothetical protein